MQLKFPLQSGQSSREMRCGMRQWKRIRDGKLVAAARLIIMPLPTCRMITLYGLFLAASYLQSILQQYFFSFIYKLVYIFQFHFNLYIK